MTSNLGCLVFFGVSCQLVALASNLVTWPPPTSEDLQPWLSCVFVLLVLFVTW